VIGPDGRLGWEALDGAPLDGLILLGLAKDVPHFAPLLEDAPVGGRAWHLFRLLGDMDAREAAIWGTARALNEWHARHLFCGRCGGRMRSFRAGWGRLCGACGAEHFPRVDPVVIMLAEYRGRVLVGQVRYVASQPWPFPGSLMIGCIAEAEGDALTLASQELDDAIWVTRDEVRAALAGDPSAPFQSPPHLAIAHGLLAG